MVLQILQIPARQSECCVPAWQAPGSQEYHSLSRTKAIGVCRVEGCGAEPGNGVSRAGSSHWDQDPEPHFRQGYEVSLRLARRDQTTLTITASRRTRPLQYGAESYIFPRAHGMTPKLQAGGGARWGGQPNDGTGGGAAQNQQLHFGTNATRVGDEREFGAGAGRPIIAHSHGYACMCTSCMCTSGPSRAFGRGVITSCATVAVGTGVLPLPPSVVGECN